MSSLADKLKKDLFPFFIVTALVGLVGWMWWAGFPWGIIATMAGLGIAFGLVELISTLLIKRTVSQEFWAWANKTQAGANKYCKCPQCGCEIVFPNKQKAMVFCVIFITVIVIINVGHLLWK